MIPLATLSDLLGRLKPGDYVDITCAGLVLLCVGIGLARGISGELSRLIGLALGATAGYWIYVPGTQTLCGLEYMRKSPQFASLIAFCVALLGGLACFLLLHYILKQVIKIVLDPFWDGALGLIAGALNAAIFLALIFTLAMILPDTAQRDLLCEQSRTGRFVAPRLTRFLAAPNPTTAQTDDPDELTAPARRTPGATAPQPAAPPPAAAPKAVVRTPLPLKAAPAGAATTAAQPARPAVAKPAPAKPAPAKPVARPAARPPGTNGLVQTTTRTAPR